MTEIERNRGLCSSRQFAKLDAIVLIRRKPWVKPNLRRIEYAPMTFRPEDEA